MKNAEAYSATLQTANVMGGPGMMARTMGRAQATEQVSGAYQYTTEAGNLGVPGLARKLGTAKASREIQSVSQAMSMGGPAGATVVGGLAGTKALSNAMAYQNVLDRVKKDHGMKDNMEASSFLSNIEHARQYGTNAAFWKEYRTMMSLGIIDKDTSPAHYAATKAYHAGLPGAAKAFALRRLASRTGRNPLEIELYKAGFQASSALMQLEAMSKTTGITDPAVLGDLIGRVRGSLSREAAIVEQMDDDPEKAALAARLVAQRETFETVGSALVHRAVSDFLDGKTSIVPVKKLLDVLDREPMGRTAIDTALAKWSLSVSSFERARRLNAMMFRNPDLKGLQVKQGDHVKVSFKRDPQFGIGVGTIDIDSSGKEDRSRMRKTGGYTELGEAREISVRLPDRLAPMKLREATSKSDGNNVAIIGIDEHGNKVTIRGKYDTKNSTDDNFIMGTGTEIVTTLGDGYYSTKSGFDGNKGWLNDTISQKSEYAAQEVLPKAKNAAESEQLASQFASGIEGLKAHDSKTFQSQLRGTINTSLKDLAGAGVDFRRIKAAQNSVDLVNATAFTIIEAARTGKITSEHAVTALRTLQADAYSLMDEHTSVEIDKDGVHNIIESIEADPSDPIDKEYMTGAVATLATNVLMGKDLIKTLPGIKPLKPEPTLNERLGMSREEGRIGRGLRRVAQTGETIAELASRPVVQAGGLAAATATAGFVMIEAARDLDNDPQKVRQMSRMAQGIMALSGVHGGPDYGETPENERIHSWREVPGVVWEELKKATGFDKLEEAHEKELKKFRKNMD